LFERILPVVIDAPSILVLPPVDVLDNNDWMVGSLPSILNTPGRAISWYFKMPVGEVKL
jgi:hypothetical protein